MPFDGTPPVSASAVPPRPKRCVRSIVFCNSFDPTDRQIIDLKWSKKKTIAQYLWDLPKDITWTVIACGRELQLDEWATTTPTQDDTIILIANPGKGAGRIIAMVALVIAAAVIAPYAAPFLAAMIGVYSAIGIAIVTSVIASTIMIAGGMLINALMPVANTATGANAPGTKTADAMSDNGSASPSYGLNGPKSTAREEAPVPIVYGKYRMGGNRCNYYAEDSGDGKTQTLYLQYAVAEGQVQGISDIYINDRPITDYTGIEWVAYNGTNDQERLAWFSDTIVPHSVGSALTTTNTVYTTSGPIDRISIEVLFPSGLYSIASTGAIVDASVTFGGSLTSTTNGSVHSIPDVTITRNDRSPNRFVVRGPDLPNDTYVLRLHRTTNPATGLTTVDSALFNMVNEITTDTVAYRNTAYYAIKATLTDQFNSEPQPTALVMGRLINIYDNNGTVVDYAWSDNPADIVLDMMLSDRWGSRLNANRIDFPAFSRWRTFCNANGLKFNGAFDYLTNLWDALMTVCRIGRATPLVSGLRWTMAIEGPADPIMIFGTQNMAKGSFKTSWSGRQGRSNEIEIQYYDENDMYRRQSAWAIDEAALAKGEPLRQATVNLIGCTSLAQAQKEAYLQLALNTGIQQSCVFDSAYDAIGCQIGDVIYVQHDMPKWGWADRIKSVTWPDITIENGLTPVADGVATTGVPLPAGDWRILALRPYALRGMSTVVTSSNNQVVVAGETSAKITRIIIDSKDYAVYDAVKIGGNTTYTLDSNPGYCTGYAVALVQTDALIEGNISRPNEWSTTLTVTNWTDAEHPQAGDQLFIGRVGKFKKPFRIVKFGHTADHTRSLSCIEYNEAVYTATGTVSTLNYSEIPNTPLQVLHLTGDQFDQPVQGAGNRYFAKATWDLPLNDLRGHAGSDIYVARNGGQYAFYEKAINGQRTSTVEAVVGESISYRVVAFDQAGFSAKVSTAPIVSVTIGSKSRAPNPPTNLSATGTIKAIAVAWTNSSDKDTQAIEVWENTTNSLASAYLVQSAMSVNFLRGALSTELTLYYWIRAVSFAGQPSSWVGPVSATTSFLLTSDIKDSIINTAKFASGIEPVTLVTALPSTKSTQIIFNTTDKMLYTWNGTAYVNAVSTTSLTGQLSQANLPSNLKVIQVLSSLPTGLTTANAGDFVFLTTDSKLYRWTGAEWVGSVSAADLTGTLAQASFPSNLQPIQRVASLPTGLLPANAGQMAFLTTDNKLYRWTGTVWTSGVAPTDLSSPLTSGNFSESLRPPERVSVLSTAGLTSAQQGRLAFLTTDNKLYRWTGTAWVNEVDANDLTTGTIAAARFSPSLRPMEVVTALPTTGLTQGRLVFLTTDEKIYRYSTTAPIGWKSTVDSADIAGNISATKIQGELVQANIPAIAATKILPGIIASQITSVAPGSLNAQLTNSQIADLDAAKLLSGTIPTARLGTTLSGLVAGTLTEAQMTALGIAMKGGAISGTQITPLSIDTPALNAGAVTAAVLAAGAVTTEKLAVGSASGNVVWNSCCTDGKIGWTVGGTVAADAWGAIGVDILTTLTSTYRCVGMGTGAYHVPALAINQYSDMLWVGTDSQKIPVVAGDWWEFQARIQAHRCSVQMRIAFYNAAGTLVGDPMTNSSTPFTNADARTLDKYKSLWGKAQVPATACYMMPYFRMVGATGADPYVFFTQVQVAQATVNQSEPKPWGPGGVTAIEGGMIRTSSIKAGSIDAGAITTDKLDAFAITAGKLAANSVVADKIQAGQIGANHLAVGNTGNEIWNPTCFASMAGWASPAGAGGVGYALSPSLSFGANWGLPAYGSGAARMVGTIPNGSYADIGWKPQGALSPAVAGARYEAQVLLLLDSCSASVGLVWFDASGLYCGQSWGNMVTGPGTISVANIEASYTRSFVLATAPATAVSVMPIIRSYGGTNPAVYFTKALFGRATLNQTEASEWVPGGLTVIDGGVIRTRTIGADTIVANSLTANELAAGSVTTEKLAVGPASGNMIWNSCLSFSATGWTVGGSVFPSAWGSVGTDLMTSQWRAVSQGTGSFMIAGTLPANNWTDMSWVGSDSAPGIAASAGESWEFQALIQAHRCSVELKFACYNASNGWTGDVTATSSAAFASADGVALSSYKQVWGIGVLPANTVRFVPVFRMLGLTGLLSASGADPYVFFTRAQVSKTTVNQTEMKPWSPGGITTIDGGMIIAGSIDAVSISAGAITAGKIDTGAVKAINIDTGAVTAVKIQAGSITAIKIGAGEITASKISVVADNLVLDPFLADAAYWSTGLSSAGWYRETTASGNSTEALGAPSGATIYSGNYTAVGAVSFQPYLSSSYIPVVPGETLTLRAKGRIVGPNILYGYIQFLSAVGGANQGGSAVVSWAANSTPGSYREAQGVVPAGASVAYPVFYTGQSGVAFSGTASVSDIRVIRPSTGGMIVDGAITASKIQAGTITGDRIFGGTITGDKMVAGTLTAATIAAGAITASKILISADNLILDPYFADPAAWVVNFGWAFEDAVTGNTTYELNTKTGIAVRAAAYSGTGVFQINQAQRIPCTAGETLALRIKATNGGSAPIVAFIAFESMTGAYKGGSAIVVIPSGQSAAYQEIQGVVPVDAISAYLTVYGNQGGARWSGNAGITDARIIRVSTAVTIIDGAITASKIHSGAITTDKLDALAVTTDKLFSGAITTDKMAANSITASKLSVSPASLNADAYFQDIAAWGIDAGGWYGEGPASAAVNLGVPYTVMLWSGTFSGTGAKAIYSKIRIPVAPGELITIRAKGRNAGSRLVQAYINFEGPTAGDYRGGAYPTWYPGEAAQYKETQVTVPAGATNAYFGVNCPAGVAWSGDAEISHLIIMRPNTASMVVDGAITAAKIATRTITATQIAGDTITADQIATGTITANELAANSVTASQIKAGSVEAGKLAANAVIAGTIAAGAIKADQIVGGEIKGYHLASEEIIADSIQVANLVIGTTKISPNAITTGKITDNAVTTLWGMTDDWAGKYGNWWGYGGDTERMYFYSDEGRDAMLFANVTLNIQNVDANFSNSYQTLAFNGSPIDDHSGWASDSGFAMCGKIYVQPGQNEVHLAAYCGGGVALHKINYIIMARAK